METPHIDLMDLPLIFVGADVGKNYVNNNIHGTHM